MSKSAMTLRLFRLACAFTAAVAVAGCAVEVTETGEDLQGAPAEPPPAPGLEGTTLPIKNTEQPNASRQITDVKPGNPPPPPSPVSNTNHKHDPPPTPWRPEPLQSAGGQGR